MKTTKGEAIAYRIRPGCFAVAIRTGRNGFLDLLMTDDEARQFHNELTTALNTDDGLRDAVKNGDTRDD